MKLNLPRCQNTTLQNVGIYEICNIMHLGTPGASDKVGQNYWWKAIKWWTAGKECHYAYPQNSVLSYGFISHAIFIVRQMQEKFRAKGK